MISRRAPYLGIMIRERGLKVRRGLTECCAWLFLGWSGSWNGQDVQKPGFCWLP
jgi:hypothetical protein